MKKVEINEKNPYVRLLTYGTLRLNHGNYKRLLENKSKYLGIYKTDNKFTMIDTGGFPIVYDKGNTSIVCDMFEINDNEVLKRIHSLEGFTSIIDDERNWYNMIELEPNTFMYIQHNYKDGYNIIKTGDWNDKI